MAAAGAAGTASPPPPLPSGVGEVSELAPLLLFPAAPGFRRPMKEEVASGEVEVVVVSSWERTRAAVERFWGGGERGRRLRVSGVRKKKTRRRRRRKWKRR